MKNHHILCGESVLYACGWISDQPSMLHLIVPEEEVEALPPDTVAYPLPADEFRRLSEASLSMHEVDFTTYGYRTLSPAMAMAFGMQQRVDFIRRLQCATKLLFDINEELSNVCAALSFFGIKDLQPELSSVNTCDDFSPRPSAARRSCMSTM